MTELIVILLTVGTTASLTRLVRADAITAKLRVLIMQRWPHPSLVSEFVRCSFCIGFWVAVPSAWLALQIPSEFDAVPLWASWPLLALTARYCAGLLSRLEP